MIENKIFLPDIEVLFNFNGFRKRPFYDGYRPSHLICEGFVASGIHHYFGKKMINPNEKIFGTITFLKTDDFPKLFLGETIEIREGEHIVGTAKVLKILNSELQKGIC